MTTLHVVGREWLEKISSSTIGFRVGDRVPFAAEKYLEEHGYIRRYGRGRNRKWLVTDDGKSALREAKKLETQ